ncbi:hypothetical protein DVA67_030530 [Solirubrobacter sp. CPCC 204708]|uniref:Uncharacterized protein n=1 Tax=Solirubrobacter deserti TaxID=2282478 RepID=A0ABT4RT86_9ACTN|nr:hypothetical protein [Solirubrobacter deserti]MBE2320340.1 hypothetical protein [Solirubrobacter deserti]MDA0141692.1 hypothetical protein [Solirubrobacter deserti]
MIEYLLARALTRLPDALRERYAAEWRADRAALSGRRLATLRWAVGLQRASRELSGEGRYAWLPRPAFDALAFGLAYYAAYALRFEGDVPSAYRDLLVQTLPFAVIGGTACMALTGNYAPRGAGALQVVKGVMLATLALIAYTALVQPTLVLTARGLAVLTVPAGVCLLFATTAGATMLLSRAALRPRSPS